MGDAARDWLSNYDLDKSGAVDMEEWTSYFSKMADAIGFDDASKYMKGLVQRMKARIHRASFVHCPTRPSCVGRVAGHADRRQSGRCQALVRPPHRWIRHAVCGTCTNRSAGGA